VQTVRDLKIVRALAKHRNFARASEELSMSQPNLSRALVRLEERIGAPLFERTRTSVAPTPYANLILDRCDPVIKGFEEINQAIAEKRTAGDRRFCVSAGPLVAVAVGIEGYMANSAAYRTSQGRLLIRDWRACIEDVLTGRSDMAVTDTLSAMAYPELEAETLGGTPLAFFCDRRHPLTQLEAAGWDDLMRFPWAGTIVQGRFTQLLPPCVDLGAAGHVDPETGDFVPAICLDSFEAMVKAVRAGRAVSFAPPALIRDEVDRGEFVLLPIHEAWMHMEYGLIWRRGKSWPRSLRRFVEKLKRSQSTSAYNTIPSSDNIAAASISKDNTSAGLHADDPDKLDSDEKQRPAGYRQ